MEDSPHASKSRLPCLPAMSFRLDATVAVEGGDPAACNSSKSSFLLSQRQGKTFFRFAAVWLGEALVQDRGLVDHVLSEFSSTTPASGVRRRVCRTAVPQGATCRQAGCLFRTPALCSLVQSFAVHESFLSAPKEQSRRRTPFVVLPPTIVYIHSPVARTFFWCTHTLCTHARFIRAHSRMAQVVCTAHVISPFILPSPFS